jgi:hypothetical protein
MKHFSNGFASQDIIGKWIVFMQYLWSRKTELKKKLCNQDFIFDFYIKRMFESIINTVKSDESVVKIKRVNSDCFSLLRGGICFVS